MAAPAAASAAMTEATSFEAMSKELKDTMSELRGKGELMSGFRREFEKLYQALEKSHNSEQRMVTTTKNLISEISSNQEALQKFKKRQEDLQGVKRRLEEETAKTFNEVSATHKVVLEKRKRANELAASMERLEAMLAGGSGWTDDQKEQKAKLEEKRDALRRKGEAKRSSVEAARKQMAHLSSQLEDATQTKVGTLGAIAELQKEIAQKKMEASRAHRRKAQLDSDLKEYKLRIEQYRADVEEKQRRIREGDEQILKVEGGLKASRSQMDKFLREYDQLHQKTIQLTDDLDNQMHTNQLLANDLNERESEIFRKRSECEQVRREDRRIEKLGRLTDKKVAKVGAERQQVEDKKAALKQQLAQVAVEIEGLAKASESKKKEITDLIREREILNKGLVKSADKTRATEDMVKIHTNGKKNIMNECAGFKSHAVRQRRMIEQLQEERQRYHQEAESANQKYLTSLEQVKLQELQLAQLQRKIVEGETKLKQQQNLYEAVRSDRNLYSKNLIEAQEEIEEMKRKFKIMNHQIEQLKEEITSKDHALVKEHFDHHKVEKEKENLKNELTRVQKQIQSSEHIIHNQDVEMQKLAHIIQEADEERQRQQKEYDAVVSERDILGSQLIRRDEELSGLYEKIKIQKSTLAKGAAQYDERRLTTSQLKQHIADLRDELNVSKQQVSNISDLRSEVFRLERELLRERTKIKRLSEELQVPLNVHRWRKLEGSDPQRFEMIRRIQALQKRLIKTTEEAVERDLLIQEKERLYVELKNILARQPGPEVTEQLAVYQQNLKQKQKQMKAMASELEMYKAQVNEYKHDIEQLTAAMHNIKQQFFANMRAQRRMQRSGGMPTAGSAGAMPLPGADMSQTDAIAAYMHGDLGALTANDTVGADPAAAAAVAASGPGGPVGQYGLIEPGSGAGAGASGGGADAAAESKTGGLPS